MAFSARAAKKLSHYLILLKKQNFIFLFTNFVDKKNDKILFNELKITLQQGLNKPLDEYYRQVFAYVISLCVYRLEDK